MTDKYEIPALTIQDLKDLELTDTLTTISPLLSDTISIGAIGSNGTSATDFTWQGSTAIPSVTITNNTGAGYNWSATPNVWTTTGTSTIGAMNQSGKISLKGEDADIDIDGKSMKAWMEKVEERLNILTPNPELEKDWDDLRKLGERYRKLEKKCKEKAEVWKKLKSMPPPKLD